MNSYDDYHLEKKYFVDTITSLNRTINDLSTQCFDQDCFLSKLNHQLIAANSRNEQLEKYIEHLHHQQNKLFEELRKKNESISSLEYKLFRAQETLRNMKEDYEIKLKSKTLIKNDDRKKSQDFDIEDEVSFLKSKLAKTLSIQDDCISYFELISTSSSEKELTITINYSANKFANPKKPQLHYVCRTCDPDKKVKYSIGAKDVGKADIFRPYVPDNKVSWNVKWDEYENVKINFTSLDVLTNKIWADVDDYKSIRNWNQIDGKVDRRSHHGYYDVIEGIPRNPVGRTGIAGRGKLGKWGPNHAADPIVTRWKRDQNFKKIKHSESGKYILEFVAIQRGDTKEWAIPGGMCDPGESISLTLKREFMEEALNSLQTDANTRDKYKKTLTDFFNKHVEIYKGYVDDPRNTDNAWMETIACNFHDNDGFVFNDIKLEAGDDAHKVKWTEISKSLKLYASHKDFIELTVEKHGAHW